MTFHALRIDLVCHIAAGITSCSCEAPDMLLGQGYLCRKGQIKNNRVSWHRPFYTDQVPIKFAVPIIKKIECIWHPVSDLVGLLAINILIRVSNPDDVVEIFFGCGKFEMFHLNVLHQMINIFSVDLIPHRNKPEYAMPLF